MKLVLQPFFWLLLIASAFLSHAKEADFLDNKQVITGFVELLYDAQTDSIFIALDKRQLNQHMLFQSSLPHGIGSNDIGLDRGQLGMTRMIRFERYGNKVMLKQLNTDYRASSSNKQEAASIDEAFADSIIAGFKLEHETDAKLYFDYTDYLLSDIHDVSGRLSRTGQGGYSADSSRSAVYMPRVKSFEKNTELEAVVTFSGQAKGDYIKSVTPDSKSVTVHLHHSFIELPDDNYKARAFHPFSGFWKHSYLDYSAAIEDKMERAYIPRHRLIKKNPTAVVSEAIEPIVYYLDPGIPEPVMTALREGAQWWNQAFEAAGYKDAFQVKVLPEDADPMDIRYNVIQWVHRATRGWSYGSSVIDPRTGEILKGHVTLGSLRVRQDYLIALGMTSPFSNENADTSEQLEMALDRIRQLSAHEVGHTLGIAHNFAASENQRASVMDYPYPLIRLEDNAISLQGAYAKGIGDWDKYVVKYGYQNFEEDESNQLLALVTQAKVDGFLYKSDPDARIPRRASADGHLWDNGSDAIDEFKRISEVRRFALAQFGSNSLPFGDAFSDLEERLVPIYYSHRYQLDALVKQISGINYRYAVKTTDANAVQVSSVDADVQKQAIALMLSSISSEYLALPSRIINLIPPKAYGSSRYRESMDGRMGIAFDPVSAAEAAAGYSLTILLDPTRLNRLSYQHSMDSKIPSVEYLIASLFDNTLKNKNQNALSDRIGLVALNVFFDTLVDDELAPEVKLALESELIALEKWISKKSKQTAHKALLKHIQQYWISGTWPARFSVKQLPPGSPI